MTRRLLVIAVSGLLGLGLAGCGAGLDAQTATHLPSVAGVDATVGDLWIRNALVPFDPEWYPAGGDAPIELAVGNEGQQPLRLVSASSPAAAAVTVEQIARVNAPAPPTTNPEQLAGPPQPEIGSQDVVTLRLLASGLTTRLDGTSSLPLELAFNNGVVLSLEVPTAPPLTPVPRGEPAEIG